MATPTGGRRATPLPVLDRPVRAIAAGGAFTLFIDADGALWAAGRNEYGELGDPALPTGRGNTKALRDAPAPVPGMRDVLAVAAGGAHILALRKDGTVWAWGFNGSFDPVAARAGQLGTDAVDFTATPRQVPGLTDVVAVAAGSAHSVALRRDGTVWVWGNNAFGQLGDGTRPRQVGDATSWRARPTQVSGLTDVIAIAAGWHHTLALKRDGTVWSWGHHGKGQLGGGAYPGAVCVSSSYLYEPLYCPRPVQVMGVYGQTPALGGVRAISAGGSSSMALLANGTVVAWGDNAEGQLGTAFREKYPDAPLADPKWRSKSAAGVHAPLPVDQWDPATQRVAPLTGVVAISMGTQHTLALKGDGTVWSWGSNGTGQLGVELQGTFKIDKKYPYAFLVPELTSAHLIAAGGLHSVVGIRR
jgi:alpha-tubulin suppressor-like RCC1 family protein